MCVRLPTYARNMDLIQPGFLDSTLGTPSILRVDHYINSLQRDCWNDRYILLLHDNYEFSRRLFSNLHFYHYRTIQSQDYESSENNPTFHITYHVHHSSSHICVRFQTGLKLLRFLPPLNHEVAVTAILFLNLFKIESLSFHCIDLYHIRYTTINWVPKHCLDILGAQTVLSVTLPVIAGSCNVPVQR